MEHTPTKRAIRKQWLMVLAGMSLCLAASAQTVPPVDVKVSAQPMGGATVYHYRIINNGTQPVTNRVRFTS